jgi:hypothetical protein
MKGVILFLFFPIITLVISLYKQSKASLILLLIVAITFLMVYLASYIAKWKLIDEIGIRQHWIILSILIAVLGFGIYSLYLNNKLTVLLLLT